MSHIDSEIPSLRAHIDFLHVTYWSGNSLVSCPVVICRWYDICFWNSLMQPSLVIWLLKFSYYNLPRFYRLVMLYIGAQICVLYPLLLPFAWYMTHVSEILLYSLHYAYWLFTYYVSQLKLAYYILSYCNLPVKLLIYQIRLLQLAPFTTISYTFNICAKSHILQLVLFHMPVIHTIFTKFAYTFCHIHIDLLHITYWCRNSPHTLCPIAVCLFNETHF
jgi:hypothetical protein